jgi:DNA-binding transcriptional LysR family regulator
VDPKEVAEMPLITGAAAMAHAGVGITFADPFSARPWLGQKLVLRDFKPEMSFEYHAIWVGGPRLPRDTQKLMVAMRTTMRTHLKDFARGR